MYQSFHVPDERVEEVKALVRSFPSLRFHSDPLPLWGTTQICLTGEVEEFNVFDQRLEKLLNPESVELENSNKFGLLSWLLG